MEPELQDLLREDSGAAASPGSGSESEYRKRFARIRRTEAVSLLVFLLGIAMVLGLMAVSVGTAFLAPSSPGVALLALGAVLVLAGAVAMIVNWRCPRCHGYLARDLHAPPHLPRPLDAALPTVRRPLAVSDRQEAS